MKTDTQIETEHTPTPGWTIRRNVDGWYSVWDENGHLVMDRVREGYAQRIVTACNRDHAFEALVEALRDLMDAYSNGNELPSIEASEPAWIKARSALALTSDNP